MNFDYMVTGEMEGDGDANGVDLGDGIRARDITRESEQWRTAIYARLGTTAKTTLEIHTQCLIQFAEMSRRMRQLERHIRILTYAPARASGPATKRGTKIRIGTPDQGQDTRQAILCSKPKMFSILWDEYQNGIGGRLPAKDFTRQQRGGCKAVYSARKIFWDCMERLIDNGLTVQSALARINSVYHDGPITQKLIALRKDERKGGHNQLCPISVDRTRGRRRTQRRNTQ